jgi:Spy/CpxP family protein refolding chaperone
MERTKGYALMFLLGAFIAGGALGFSADRVMDVKREHARGPRAYRQRMVDELKLTAQQSAAVDTLIAEKHRQILALYKPVQPQLDSIAKLARIVSDSTHQQIKRLLTPEQAEKFDKLREEARKELAERRRADTVVGPSGPGSPPRY